MITTVQTSNVGGALFEAMKHGVQADHLGGGVIVFDTAAVEKISLIIEKVNATILSEEDVVPLTPYKQEIGGSTAYDIYRRME